MAFLFALSPDGVCQAAPLPTRWCALTAPFQLFSPGPWPKRESPFLWHFPSGRPARPLAGILPCGARTFLTGTRCAPSAAAWPTPRKGSIYQSASGLIAAGLIAATPHVPADARSGSSFARRPPRVPYRLSGIPHAPHVTRRAARKTKKGPARLALQASGASRQYMCLPGMSYFLGSFFILAKNLLYSVRHSSHWAYASSLRWSVRPYVSLSSVAIQSLTFLAPL